MSKASKIDSEEEVIARDCVFRLRCSQAELLQWKAKAKAHRVSLSAYARDLLEGEVTPRSTRVPKFDPALMLELKRMGSNLNQIALVAYAQMKAGHGFNIVAIQMRLVSLERGLDQLIT